MERLKRRVARDLLVKLFNENKEAIKESLKDALEAELRPQFLQVLSAFEEQVKGPLDSGLLMDEVVDEVLDELLLLDLDEEDPILLESALADLNAVEPSGSIVPPPDERPLPRTKEALSSKVEPHSPTIPPPDERAVHRLKGASPVAYSPDRFGSEGEYVEHMVAHIEGLLQGGPTKRGKTGELTQAQLELASFYLRVLHSLPLALDALAAGLKSAPLHKLKEAKRVLDLTVQCVESPGEAQSLIDTLEALSPLLSEPPLLGHILFTMGRLSLEHLGDMEMSREFLTKATLIDPENSEAAALLTAVSL